MNPTPNRSTLRLVVSALTLLALTACGAARKPMKPAMAPLAVATEAPKPAPLVTNHFQRDRIGTLSEDKVREILSAPVYLEADARIGIVPVVDRYEPDGDLPLTAVTGQIADRLADAGMFEVVSEISTDWPSTSSIAGLRELAARYRAEYLLLYRHRFVERRYTNAWSWAWVTLVGGLMVPGETFETAGVLEATLFDVKSGTLLFTVFERVDGEEDAGIWHTDRTARRLKEGLLGEAVDGLQTRIDEKLRSLIAARPAPEGGDEALARRPTPPVLTATR